MMRSVENLHVAKSTISLSALVIIFFISLGSLWSMQTSPLEQYKLIQKQLPESNRYTSNSNNNTNTYRKFESLKFPPTSNFNQNDNSEQNSNINTFPRNLSQRKLEFNKLTLPTPKSNLEKFKLMQPFSPQIAQPKKNWYEKNVQPILNNEYVSTFLSSKAVKGIFGILIFLFVLNVIGNIFQTIGDNFEEIINVIVIILVIVAVFAAFGFGFWLLGFLFLFLLRTINTTNLLVIGSLFAFASGTSLYYFRQRNKVLYGLSEIIAGIMLVPFTIYNTESYQQNKINLDSLNGFEIVTLVLLVLSSIYIIVRGYDNVGEGNWKNYLKNSWNILTKFSRMFRIFGKRDRE